MLQRAISGLNRVSRINGAPIRDYSKYTKKNAFSSQGLQMAMGQPKPILSFLCAFASLREISF